MKSTATSREAQGAWIMALRERAGLSRRELAELVHRHPQHIRNIEVGARGLTPELAEAIATALDVRVADLTPADADASADESLTNLVEVPDFRLYTHEQAAALIGGGITANLLRRLAQAGVEHTRIGGKVRWTLAQLRAAVAEHAVTGPTTRTRKADAATSRRTNSGSTRRPRTHQAPASGGLLAARPGRRYQQSA